MGKQVKKHGYSCKLVRVVDGDTADAMIDLGFNVWVKERIRFYGVDTWESRTRDLEEKKKGLAAKEYVKDLLENSDEGKFSIISHGKGKYGRVLGELFVKGHEKSVNELLKENGHAYEYHGGKKKVFGVDITSFSTPYGDMNVARNIHLDGTDVKMLGIDMKHCAYRPLSGNGVNRDTSIYVGVQTLENSGVDRRVDLILTEAGMEWSMPEAHAIWK